jgi:hypothetical protein
VGESIVWLLGVELCSADGLEVAFLVVGTGLALGGVPVELGAGLVAVEGLALGAELVEGESIVWLLNVELCSADGLEVAFTVVDTGLGAALDGELGRRLIAVEWVELGAELGELPFCIVGDSLGLLPGSELS